MMRLRILPAVAVLGMLSLGVGAYAVSRPATGSSGESETSRGSLAQANLHGRGTKAHARKSASRLTPAARLERSLRRRAGEHLVAVVVFYSPASALDRLAILEARAGAREADAGFAAIDVTRNRAGAELASRHGLRDVPALLIVRRSTKRVMKIVGYVDRAAVAQALENVRRWRF
ncbi:MAG: hypothetical protein M3327_06135 [Actinomycetota bacterium]|nr:hypothetical protein [Actinomycetota bacterium]